MSAELPVIVKTHDLIAWADEHLRRFPRSHRYTLGQRIEQRLYEVLEALIGARYNVRERPGLLRLTNVSLEVLRHQLRLEHRLRLMRTNSYGFAARSLDDIGRMVGGWLR